MYCDHLKRHEIIIFAFWLSTAGEKRGSCRVGGESTAAALAKRGGAGRAGWARKSSSGAAERQAESFGQDREGLADERYSGAPCKDLVVNAGALLQCSWSCLWGPVKVAHCFDGWGVGCINKLLMN